MSVTRDDKNVLGEALGTEKYTDMRTGSPEERIHTKYHPAEAWYLTASLSVAVCVSLIQASCLCRQLSRIHLQPLPVTAMLRAMRFVAR